MYLKSLELQGFKSFPDKVKLTFDKGLTAVVGPTAAEKVISAILLDGFWGSSLPKL